MHDIFLSYSTVDRERLEPLVAALEQQGWSVFWDHRSVPIGEKWREVIEEAVCQCRCVLVVWSQASVKSKWVKEEASEGSRREVLLPIRVDDVLPPFGFREDQAGNFIDWNGTTDYPEFTRLTDRIRSLLEEQAKREAEEAAADQKVREAAKQKTLAQERAAEQQAREEAERQAKAKQERLNREKEAAAEKVRKEVERQSKVNSDQSAKKFPWLPALFISAAVFGGGGYWQFMGKSPVGASPAGDSSPTAVPQTATVVEAQPVVLPTPPELTPAERIQQAKAWLDAEDEANMLKAVNLLQPLADANNGEAKRLLGAAYYYGLGVTRNRPKGCTFYKDALKTGHADAETVKRLCPK